MLHSVKQVAESIMALDCGADSHRRYPYPFLTTDVAYATSRTYDYIIVGGGAAGCPLATTLSEKYKVLLLERGDSPYGDPDIEDESGFLKPLSKADEYYSVAQNFVTEDGVQGTRGRVLGGSTCLNAGFYSRASVSDIVAMQLWDSDLIQHSYEWVEKQVSFKPNLGAFHGAFRDALLSHGVQPNNGYTLEHKHGTKMSDSIFDNHGKRHTAADLLKHADRHNIVVLLNATANRILFQMLCRAPVLKHRAIGVEFVNSENSVTHRASLRGNGEVILCAGALGSPQLLMLSGIGPSRHLRELGIPVVHDLPGVGQKIGDNPKTDLYMLHREPCDVLLVQVVGILERPYNEFRKYAHPNAVFLEEARNPHVYLEEATLVKDAPDGEETKQAYLGWLTHKLGHPVSTGELRLRTVDPRDNPSVRYNYYSHPFDLDAAVKGTRLLANILHFKQIKSFGYENPDDAPEYLKNALAEQGPPLPPDISDDEAMRRFCREAMTTIWHYHGGCHLGSVLDMNYKVKGVDGVRVVDASTFVSTPGTNPQATIMMLGRYKGMEIMRERKVAECTA